MNTADPTPSSGSSAADPLDARRLALLDRLDQLIGAGMDLVQGLAAQASGAGSVVAEGDVILAYSRAARAVRMAILLQSHLVDTCGARGDVRCEAAPAGRTTAQDHSAAERDSDAREPTERGEVAERLERDDIYRAVQTRPAHELVIEIANDLGVAPDWPDFTSTIAVAMAGGGPRADPGVQPGEERGVEGAGFKRNASAKSLCDSS